MTLHLVKLAVGIDDVSMLAERQSRRLEEARTNGQPVRLRHLTRSMPRRADEIVGGGSIYWVIRQAVRARQKILGLERTVNDRGQPRCAIVLDREIVPVEARPCRPFQGWRYLESAPPDSVQTNGDSLPDGMAAELRSLGLL